MSPRVVVISGASSGIGLATARRFAAGGDQVVNIDTNAPGPGDAVGEWVAADVRDWTALDAAVGQVERVHGAVDVAIASAGISKRRPFTEMTEQDAREIIDVNLMGVIGLWQAAARRMITAQRGVLLATASANGSAGYPCYADYNATKAGVLALCRTVAIELAPYVRTACVSPGYVMTPTQRAEYTPAMLADVNKQIPAGRHADPAEIAEAFHYLASPAARYITGQQLIADGGELAGGTASSHGTVFNPPRGFGGSHLRPAPRAMLRGPDPQIGAAEGSGPPGVRGCPPASRVSPRVGTTRLAPQAKQRACRAETG